MRKALLQVLYCWGLAILMLANAGHVEGFLYFTDWVAAVFFAVVGAIAGWQGARN